MEEWVAMFIMASALGMDVLSVSLGMGMNRFRIREIGWIGILFGLFHVIMTLIGMVTGSFFSKHIHIIATFISGGLLFLIGLHMVASSFQQNDNTIGKPLFGWGLLLIAFSVSLDSLSAGLSLGILGAKMVMTITAIGVVSTLFAWFGLLMGAKFNRYIGPYGQLLGGFILIGFGIKLILP